MRRSAPGSCVGRFVAFTLLASALVAFAPAKASAQAQFLGVGDLPGGPISSSIRDAVKHNGVIYAVGGSSARPQPCPAPPCVNTDTGILWQWDGSTATLTALPDLVAVNPANPNFPFITASAITPDATYIASRARSGAFNGQRQAVRVTTSGLTNLNLNAAPFTVYGGISLTVAIADDGSVVYGMVNNGSRAARFDIATSSSSLIPLLSGTDTNNAVAGRGSSASGNVAVGSSWSNLADHKAFRYVHGGSLTQIAPLPGGTSNDALAVSPDGNLVLVRGDSSAYPNGEVYLYNATTGSSTPLGSPNRPWSPLNVGGMTADGSVVAIEFGGPTRGFSYFRNSRGWFHLTAALGANGIDTKADGWDELRVLGISPDGTLVFGHGVHHGELEGFVAEFPAGYLATFDPQPVAPSSTALVGAWRVNDVESGTPGIVVFMADGTYYMMQPAVTGSAVDENASPGFERGLYTWNAATGAFTVTTLNDTNGDAGLSDNNGFLSATLFVSGDSLSFSDGGAAVGTRIVAPASTPLKNTLVGGWVIGNPAVADDSLVVVFDTDGTYYHAQDGPNEGGSWDGIEVGTYSWDATERILRATGIDVDTNGDWGLSDPFGDVRMQTALDGLTAQAGDDTGLMTAFRIIDVDTLVTSAGFYRPVSPVAGFLNRVKGGQTVPLKFNITVNGVEKTDTGGIEFSLGSVACTGSGPETPAAFVTTGGTTLRYDTTGGQFIQNWQTPDAPGCYIARMTMPTGGVVISALFQVR